MTVYEHTKPTSTGYAERQRSGVGEQIPLVYAATHLRVDPLLGLT